MVSKKLLLVAIGLMCTANGYAAGSQEQPSHKAAPLKLPPPPPLSPAPLLNAKEARLNQEAKFIADPQIAVRKEDMDSLLLAKAQIEMLKEANSKAETCHHMASEIAAQGAADFAAFKEMMKNPEEKSIFPEGAESIFNRNPHFCSEAIDPRKMDRESFVSMLKNQKQTTKTMLADILNKILDWKDVAEIQKNKNKISEDLRALSSFCTGPLKMLDIAINNRKEELEKARNKSLFGKFKNKVTGRQN
ncbi:MAG: hypothetical protein K0R52_486 [Alphaproteobacteria bacterium]|jgi:hypothetical protein|nr:hypothetical protein [Alphaproteobacteria bacterium]